MKKVIIGEKIVKTFGTGGEAHNVLDDVTVSIDEGEFVAVMGPSGSGKSTLLFALSGIDHIDSGQISFDGQNLSALRENELADLRRTQMGFVFQQPTMLKNLNLLDNIILPTLRDNRKEVRAVTEKARKLMCDMGIGELEKRSITEVSGGQLQRAGICRALMHHPLVIFGDEPTGALNSKSAEDVMDILAKINEDGTAVVLVTHDAKIAAGAQRILFLSDGKIASELRLGKASAHSMDARVEQVTKAMRKIGI